MRGRTFLLAILAVLLVIPAATSAMANDSMEVEMQVLPAGTLTVDVPTETGLAPGIPGQSTSGPFWMNIVNTGTTAWTVSVDGTDLVAFERGYCDENGCERNPIVGGPTIPENAIFVSGGGIDDWDPNPFTYNTDQQLGGAAVTLTTGTAGAYGSFGLNNPEPSVRIDVPIDATTYYEYFTTLTFTITATP